ncbi:MAG: hypothetical protein U1F48_19120 [Burkholderiales bacterium]
MRIATSQRNAIRGMLADLKMPGALEAVDHILSDVDGGPLGATDAISRLLTAQISLRNNPPAAGGDALLATAGREDARCLRP